MKCKGTVSPGEKNVKCNGTFSPGENNVKCKGTVSPEEKTDRGDNLDSEAQEVSRASHVCTGEQFLVLILRPTSWPCASNTVHVVQHLLLYSGIQHSKAQRSKGVVNCP